MRNPENLTRSLEQLLRTIRAMSGAMKLACLSSGVQPIRPICIHTHTHTHTHTHSSWEQNRAWTDRLCRELGADETRVGHGQYGPLVQGLSLERAKRVTRRKRQTKLPCGTERAVHWPPRWGQPHAALWYSWIHLRYRCCRQVRRPSGAAMAAAPSGPMLLPLQTRASAHKHCRHAWESNEAWPVERAS